MKIENLGIIFLIIIIPIVLVLSEYIDKKIETEKLELEYNRRLLKSTQDAINAYRINTINDAYGDVTTSKIEDIEATTNIFFNSLASNFNYIGHKAGIMKDYVPAVVFTLYDGYYIHSNFNNTLTQVDKFDKNYSDDNEVIDGLKPYVYYTCRYTRGSEDDFIITYTLDNYITITGKVNGDYHYDYGYLYPIEGNYSISKKSDTEYEYDGITFSDTDTEEMKEFVGDKEYSYVKINGVKYYLEHPEQSKQEWEEINGVNVDKNAKIFFIDNKGNKNYNQTPGYKADQKNFLKYYFAIIKNKSAFEYYKNAYEFSKAVLGDPVVNYIDKAKTMLTTKGYNLKELKSSDAEIYNTSKFDTTDTTKISEYGDFKIFEGDIPLESSNFNKHRKSIIRYVVETNLSAAISSYTSSSVKEFVMPKISESDWELIQNESCAIAFLQGMNIGTKQYNGYKVVSNPYTKEHIDENDIYILTKDNTYCKPTDNNLQDNVKTKDTYYSGIWKLNFEIKKDLTTTEKKDYVPMSYYKGTDQTAYSAYLASYTSIIGKTGINAEKRGIDMYEYMHSKEGNADLRKVYYTGLGRERWGSFNINNINYELYGNNGSEYFLKDY